MRTAKRMSAATVFPFTLLMAPSGFAQILMNAPIELLVVGENNPYSLEDLGGPSKYAQEFSLSSDAWVSRVDLSFAKPATCTFSVLIVGGFNEDGTFSDVVLDLPESLAAGDYSFSDSFDAVFVPHGSYYFVEDFTTGSAPCANESMPPAYNKVGSPRVGTLGAAWSWWATSVCYPAPPCWSGLLLGGDPEVDDTISFDLAGPWHYSPPTGGGLGEKARLVVEGPVTPPPGGPVQAQLEFLDIDGNAIGANKTVTLNPGETQWLDLDLNEFVSKAGERVEVRPVILQVPKATGAPAVPTQLTASLQILNQKTGYGTLLAPFPQPGASAPQLVAQDLAGGQSMRINVAAVTSEPCVATLGFTNKSGKAVGPGKSVNLTAGKGKSLDLDSTVLGLTTGQTTEVQPVITVKAPAPGEPESICQASVEVYDHASGQTWTHQSALLPAVQ